MIWIDRFVSCFGACRLAKQYPGIGYLLTEVIPVIVWGFFCGAMSYDNYYLIQFLKLLGASNQQIAIIPILYFSAFSLQYVFMHRHSQANSARSKEISVRTSLIGRALWLLIPIWAIVCHQCSWHQDITIYGILLVYFIAHIQLFFSLNYFVTWTQALVQKSDRSSVFAFRYFGMYITLGIIAYLVSVFWPDKKNIELQFWYFLGIFGLSTLVCLASTWMLAMAPDMPEIEASERSIPHNPVRQILKQRPRLRALILFSSCNGAAMCCFVTWLPNYLDNLNIREDSVSFWQSCAYIPCILLGFVISIRLIKTISSFWTLIIALGLWPLSIICFLLLKPDSPAILLPLCFAVYGFAKALLQIGGFTALHDLSPNNDVRLPALNFCAVGIGGLCASLLILFGRAPLEAMLLNANSAWTFPGIMFIAAACLFTLGGLLLLHSHWLSRKTA